MEAELDGELGPSKYVIVLCGRQLPHLVADNCYLGCIKPPHPPESSEVNPWENAGP